MRVHAVLLAAVSVMTSQLAMAQDPDLDLIPDSVLEAPQQEPPSAAQPEPPQTLQVRLFFEYAFTGFDIDHQVVVPFPNTLDRWQNRASLDAQLSWKPFKSLSFTLSDRLSLYAEEHQSFTPHNAVRNNFREGYVAWEPLASTYLELGRINVRNGVALGFNPTDFMKTRTLVGQSSLDPTVMRQNRLGTLMLRGQVIGSSIAASLAVAPKLAPLARITERLPPGIDPHFAATNGALRLLGTLGFEIWDLDPQLLGYFETGRSKLGANVSRAIGDALIVYAEWAAGPEKALVPRAIEFGRETGTLPFGAPSVVPAQPTRQFRNDLATGLSWTIASTVTLNLEYDFHESGVSARDWRNWFQIISAPGASPILASEHWYVRSYADEQQEPVTQHQVFVHVSWPQAFVNELELSGFAFVNLYDGSVLSQIAVAYYSPKHWTGSIFVSSNLGAERSERGSFPQRWSVIAQLTFYL